MPLLIYRSCKIACKQFVRKTSGI